MAYLRTLILTGFVLFAPALAFADDFKELQGTWNPTLGMLGNQQFSPDQLKAMRLQIKGNNYEVTVGNESDKGTLKVDPKAKPAAMDIIGTNGPNKGKTILAIYEVKNDYLRVCYALSDDAKRPAEFKAGGTDANLIVVYKKVK